MNKKTLITTLLFLAGNVINLYANDLGTTKSPLINKNDTLYTELKNDIIILSTTKETNSLKNIPAAVSFFSQKNLEAYQISSIKDLSAIVPNYFAANYGSKMTAPLYIRGVGARSGTQNVSLYVDNIPYFNTTAFDVELCDIQRLEVLRGTQGTLYGRNAMGGIINIYTYSPLDYQRTNIRMGAGSYGLYHVDASKYMLLTDNMGISGSIYYKRSDGHFRNSYTGHLVDGMENIGGRSKFAWKINPKLHLTYAISYDYADQGAFPYKNLETNEITANVDGSYRRNLFTNGMNIKYLGEGYEINSTTGYQYLKDNMVMDIDYTSERNYEINQKQRQNSLSQEFTIRSKSPSNYKWSYGLFGFYDYLNTNSPVYMQEDAVNNHILGNMNRPNGPVFSFNHKDIDLNSRFKNTSQGVAVFHQSTYDNLFVKGLSATVGLRLDYEHKKLNYNSYTEDLILYMKMPNIPGRPPMPTMSFSGDTAIVGNAKKNFLELLPRMVLKYDINDYQHIYLSASKGYKTGGHNIQLFADLLQEAFMSKLMSSSTTNNTSTSPTPINNRITYEPEYSWNYEFGGQSSFLNNSLQLNYALFYMDIKNIQLTRFVESLGGRMVVNGGKARSYGAEIAVKGKPCNGFFIYANYGYANAEFIDYITTEDVYNPSTGKNEEQTINYSEHHIPFAPSHTFSVGATIEIDINNSSFLDKIAFDNNFNGIGKIYWHENNVSSQNFYGIWNSKVQFQKGLFTLEAWSKNLLNRHYNTFVFDSGRGQNLKYYGQSGLPREFGCSLKMTF